MKNLKLSFLLFVLLLFSFGCAGPKEQTSVNTSFVFTSGLSALESQTGGIILYGRNVNNKADAFTMIVDGDAKKIEVNNGSWEFLAVSWTGFNAALGTYGNSFEGEVRCSKVTDKVFDGGDVELSFTLNKANCNDSDFGLAKTYYQLGDLKLARKYLISANNKADFDHDKKRYESKLQAIRSHTAKLTHY